jgi:cytochrome c2
LPRGLRAAAVLALIAGTAALAATASRPGTTRAQTPVPQTDGWVLVVSRCVICHSVEIAVQQRQGPLGWGVIVDRMVTYGMPLLPEERAVLIAYLVRHFGDPDGR